MRKTYKVEHEPFQTIDSVFNRCVTLASINHFNQNKTFHECYDRRYSGAEFEAISCFVLIFLKTNLNIWNSTSDIFQVKRGFNK